MNGRILAVIVIFVTNFRLCQGRTYDNFTLYHLTPLNVNHLKFLQNLEVQKYMDVFFWKRPYKVHEEVHLIVNPIDKSSFLERINHFNISAKVVMEDVQTAFYSQIIKPYLRAKTNSYTWKNYHTLEDIYQWLADIAIKYDSKAVLKSIGQSGAGREIYALSIKLGKGRNKVVVEGGSHGNEWISVEFITYLIDHLLGGLESKDKRLNRVARSYHWYIIPVLNPDGYDYSQKEDRLWRKNRNTHQKNGTVSYGVDLNRNFDYAFGKFGTSNNPSDDNYCGPKPFSEPETKVFASYMANDCKNAKFFFSIHSYGQKIIIPYGDRILHLDNYEEVANYAQQASMKMYRQNGFKYAVGTTYDTLGLRISGDSASWAKKTFGIRYVYTFLLRDTGDFGYALPNNEIIKSCEEALTGMLEILTVERKTMRAKKSAEKLRPELFVNVVLFWLMTLY